MNILRDIVNRYVWPCIAQGGENAPLREPIKRFSRYGIWRWLKARNAWSSASWSHLSSRA